MAPRANWKGYLKLSLVSCPITLSPATSTSEKTSFHRHCHIYRIYCLLLASHRGPVLMKSTIQRFSVRPKNRLYLLNVTKLMADFPPLSEVFDQQFHQKPHLARRMLPWWPDEKDADFGEWVPHHDGDQRP
jgi:hypothetical protein